MRIVTVRCCIIPWVTEYVFQVYSQGQHASLTVLTSTIPLRGVRCVCEPQKHVTLGYWCFYAETVFGGSAATASTWTVQWVLSSISALLLFFWWSFMMFGWKERRVSPSPLSSVCLLVHTLPSTSSGTTLQRVLYLSSTDLTAYLQSVLCHVSLCVAFVGGGLLSLFIGTFVVSLYVFSIIVRASEKGLLCVCLCQSLRSFSSLACKDYKKP